MASRYLKLFDIRSSSQTAQLSIPAYSRGAVEGTQRCGNQLLTYVANKEGCVKIWDMRRLAQPLQKLVTGPGLRDARLTTNKVGVTSSQAITIYTLGQAPEEVEDELDPLFQHLLHSQLKEGGGSPGGLSFSTTVHSEERGDEQNKEADAHQSSQDSNLALSGASNAARVSSNDKVAISSGTNDHSNSNNNNNNNNISNNNNNNNNNNSNNSNDNSALAMNDKLESSDVLNDTVATPSTAAGSTMDFEEELASRDCLGVSKRVRRIPQSSARGHAVSLAWQLVDEQADRASNKQMIASLTQGGSLEIIKIGVDIPLCWGNDNLAIGSSIVSVTESLMKERVLKGYGVDGKFNSELLLKEDPIANDSLAGVWAFASHASRHSGALGLCTGLIESNVINTVTGLCIYESAVRESLLELAKPNTLSGQAGLLLLKGQITAACELLESTEATAPLSLMLAGAEKAGDAWRAAAVKSTEGGVLGAVLRLIGGARDWDMTLNQAGRLCLGALLLPDDQLGPWLQLQSQEEIQRGSIEAILCLGLQRACLPALQAYLDRTSDIQVYFVCFFLFFFDMSIL
jgi:hypothetical protein